MKIATIWTRDAGLAVRFEHLTRHEVVADRAKLARPGHVSRTRLTQIVNLLNLAPDIQEEILFLPRVKSSSPSIPVNNMNTVPGSGTTLSRPTSSSPPKAVVN